jgi:hypothetical protein
MSKEKEIARTVEMVATTSLIPYARNAKKHTQAQIALVAFSIQEFGFNSPVLIDDDNGIIAGHCRVLAAEKLGLAETPCIRLSHLDDNQKKAYILADNRLAEVGSSWDYDMLRVEMESIDFSEFKALSAADFDFQIGDKASQSTSPSEEDEGDDLFASDTQQQQDESGRFIIVFPDEERMAEFAERVGLPAGKIVCSVNDITEPE